ncbi:MAG: hypothetical protein KAJ62_09480, partial [Desulfobacteraceae bacterium]|nr:hypothetical protein [Desulfobacteraceae bacterium]
MKKKRSNWPYLQKDKGGNLVLYPATFFFPVKGYIIPDEKIRKEFINMNIPACVLGAIMFIHAREYGIF